MISLSSVDSVSLTARTDIRRVAPQYAAAIGKIQIGRFVLACDVDSLHSGEEV